MPRRKGGLYVPLDVNFWDDPRIVRAGEKAAVLYLNMATACKRLGSDGRLEALQIDRLHVPGWKARLDILLREELVLDLQDGGYTIASWLQHNDPVAVVQARRAADADRKRGTPSARNPDGIPTESERKRREVERREVAPPPESAPTLVPAGIDCVHDSDAGLCPICVRAVS